LAKSLATEGHGAVTIKRNSPTLLNAVYTEKFFYDLRESSLERQVSHVIMDSLEFGTNFTEIVQKLKQSEEYTTLFEEAYGDFPQYALTKWSISDALAAYVAKLTSFNSTFDKYIRNEIPDIDPAVVRGFNLFTGKAACATCHFAPTFNGLVPPAYSESESEVLGVPAKNDSTNLVLDGDIGRFGGGSPKEEAPFYEHSFKTVTIRNIAETAPYMHNGAYETLEEVVDFYNKGGGAGMGIHVPYQTLPDAPLGLTAQEQNDIIAFMKSLSDNPYENDMPDFLPEFEGHSEWNTRTIGGRY
ncbi:MAG: cytochrome c peroxidase, partial [Bacteroidota bacterium]